MTTFKQLGVSESILKALELMGFEEATPIQRETIPHALEGNDMIGQAQTGTGKTAAFGIPMIERFSKDVKSIQGLVVTPTRELAIQVAEELNNIGKVKRVRALAIFGGQQMQRQIRALRNGPQIVVATPGRLLDHMKRRTIGINNVKVVVLDEADEMLNMGFIDDIKKILQGIPESRQTLLFSATMPKEIRDIATYLMNNPKEIKVKTKELTVTNIEQFFIEVPESKKFDTLSNHLDVESPELSIVFARTKKRVDEIADGVKIRGFQAEGIHGDLTQGKRMSVLNKFKQRQIEVLVATDVAARGLDISGVSHVYNFDIPQDPESYVHRIGRTGRAGETGKAYSFITPREIPHLQAIQKVTKSPIKRITAPTMKDALKGQQQNMIDQIVEAIEEKNLTNYYDAAEELLHNHDSLSVVSAALSLLVQERKSTPVKLTATEPIRVKKERGFQRQGRKGRGKQHRGKGQRSGRRNYRRGRNN